VSLSVIQKRTPGGCLILVAIFKFIPSRPGALFISPHFLLLGKCPSCIAICDLLLLPQYCPRFAIFYIFVAPSGQKQSFYFLLQRVTLNGHQLFTKKRMFHTKVRQFFWLFEWHYKKCGSSQGNILTFSGKYILGNNPTHIL